MLLLAFLLLPVALKADGDEPYTIVEYSDSHDVDTPLILNTRNMNDKVVKMCINDIVYTKIQVVSKTVHSDDFCYYGDLGIGTLSSPLPKLPLGQISAIIFEREWNRSLEYIMKPLSLGNALPYYSHRLPKDGVRVVILHSNNMTQLEEGSIEASDTIAILNLSENDIKYIHVNCFRNLKELIELNLDWNQIHSLMKDVFAGLAKIQSISLVNNQLTKCAEGVFSILSNSLESIYLGNNKILKIAVGSFNSSSLTQLGLSGNQITRINRKMFKALPKLAKLYLGFNNISNIRVFNLTHLDTLDLRNNYVTKIKRNTFKRLPKLSKLDLTSNIISEIEDESFDLPLLLELHLRDNLLTEINDNTFKGLPNLIHLDLRSNRIRNISDGATQYLKQLKNLEL